MVRQNPYDDPAGEYRDSPYRSAYFAQKTSALAVLSVLAGLLSFPMMCLFFLSIPVSLFAIVCGHMARGVVRDTNGQYSGMEMATFGLILGYCSFLIMGSVVSVAVLSTSADVPAVSVTTSSKSENSSVLLKQAKGQLLGGTEAASFGVSTSDSDAQGLARHFIDTLHVLDNTHFTETTTSANLPQREYRAFVQLNKTSVAFLLFVPDYERFTESAAQTLHESCWLIGQRTVDDVLPEGSKIAVALYSPEGCKRVMTGVTKRTGPTKAGLKREDAKENRLATFFQLRETNPTNSAPVDDSTTQSQIDLKPVDEVSLPAEVE